MVKDYPIPYRLYSAPLAWPVSPAPGMGLAVIVGERRGAQAAPFAMAYSAPGREMPGFPWLRGSEPEVAPGNSVLIVSPQGAVAVIDLKGQLRLLRDGRELRGLPLSPASSLPAVSALPVDASAREWVVLSRDFQPYADSRSALGVFSLEHGMSPRFPVPLASAPETQPPAIDAARRRVFVALRSGQVDGFSIADGARLRGFPTAVIETPRPPGGFRLACSPDCSALYLATGGNLLRIDPNGGKSTVVHSARERRWEGVVADASSVVAFDAEKGSLVWLDANAQETAAVPVKFSGTGSAPFMTSRGSDVALVGSVGSDTGARVDQLFAQHAPPPVSKQLEEVALEEAQVRFRTSALDAAQKRELSADLRRLKRSWLDRTLGVERVDQLLRVVAGTQVQVLRRGPAGLPSLVVDDSISGATTDTGFSQCEHVLPVFWSDPRTGATVLLVGLNADTSGGKPPAPFRSVVRSYTLPRAG